MKSNNTINIANSAKIIIFVFVVVLIIFILTNHKINFLPVVSSSSVDTLVISESKSHGKIKLGVLHLEEVLASSEKFVCVVGDYNDFINSNITGSPSVFFYDLKKSSHGYSVSTSKLYDFYHCSHQPINLENAPSGMNNYLNKRSYFMREYSNTERTHEYVFYAPFSDGDKGGLIFISCE